MICKILLILGLATPAMAFTPQFYLQSTSALQSGATFYVSSGTVAGQLTATTVKTSSITISTVTISSASITKSLDVSSYTFIHNWGDPAVGECLFVNAANPNTSCDFTDPGATSSIGSFARIASPIAAGRNSFGYYADDTQATSFPGRTWGGLFYSALSTYQNIGIEGDAGESSPLSTNIAGNFHGTGPAAANVAYGVKSICDGAAQCTAGYFAASSTNAVNMALDASGGGNVLLSSTTLYGFHQLFPRTLAQLAAMIPADVFREYGCSDCSFSTVCISTQQAVAKWADISSRTVACH